MLRRTALVAVLIVSAICVGSAFAEQTDEAKSLEQAIETLDIDQDVSIVLLDLQKDEVLFEQNADNRVNTASTAKLLTCLVALEYCDTGDVVSISSEATQETGSSLYLKAEERLLLYDLLSGMMVTSGNDAAYAVAEYVSGSQSDFAKLMNITAEQIGMTDSHFTNPIGISDTENYSTARDMATLAKYAMSNEELKKMAGRSVYVMPKTNLQEEREVYSTNLMYYKEGDYYYEYATGLKTGASQKGKGNLVASAQKDGIELICVVMNDTSEGYTQRWEIAKAMFEFGFSTYTQLDIGELLSEKSVIELEVENSDAELICTTTGFEGQYIIVSTNEAAQINSGDIDVEIQTAELAAPIEKNDVVGSVTFVSKSTGIELFSGKLTAANSVYVNQADKSTSSPKQTSSIEEIPDTLGSQTHVNWLEISVFLFIACALTLIFGAVLGKRRRG